jgi:hypothetical protein
LDETRVLLLQLQGTRSNSRDAGWHWLDSAAVGAGHVALIDSIVEPRQIATSLARQGKRRVVSWIALHNEAKFAERGHCNGDEKAPK